MLLYHGTSVKNLQSILDSGIRPRGRRAGNWNHAVKSNPKAVYLTNAYPLYFAMATGNWPVAIIEIDTDKLVQQLLSPDEDYLEQATRFDRNFEFLVNENMAFRTKYFRSRALRLYNHLWKQSLNGLGTCCYYGTIPTELITRYVIINEQSPIKHLSDPTITIINFKLLGNYYINLTRKIFGDSDYLEVNPAFKSYMENLDRAPRDGIEVITGGP